MGWYFTTDATKRDIILERTKNWANSDGTTGMCLTHSIRANVLWTVWEIKKPDGTAERYIGCDLLGSSKGCGWGYKSMSESMGPYYFSCPLAYLAMVPEPPGECAKGWREQVREYHRLRSQKVAVGQVVTLRAGYKPSALTVVNLRPFQGRDETGRLYRIPRRALAEQNAKAVTV